MQTNQDFEMAAGDTKQISVPVKDANGSPQSLTGASAEWSCSEYQFSTTPLITKLSTDVPSDIGINTSTSTITVTIKPNNTSSLLGVFYHKLIVTDSSGNVSTVTTGKMTVV